MEHHIYLCICLLQSFLVNLVYAANLINYAAAACRCCPTQPFLSSVSLLLLLLAGFVVVGALLLHPLLVYSAIHLWCSPGKRTTKSSPASLVLDQHYPTLPPLPFISTVSEIISSMPGRPCRALRPPRRIMYLQNWSLACLTQISAAMMAEPKKTHPMLNV